MTARATLGWAARILASTLLVALAGCSLTLVRPVIERTAPDGTVQPTCFSNSYLWPALDTAAATVLAVAPAVLLQRSRDRCAAGDDRYCSSTDSLILLYTFVGVPVFGGSAYSGFTAAHRCRQAGSPPRWKGRSSQKPAAI